MMNVLTSPEFFSGLTQTITALTALIAAIASLFAMVRSRQNGEKIEAVHLATNGRMDQLVAEVRESSIAKGAKQEADRAVAAATNGQQ